MPDSFSLPPRDCSWAVDWVQFMTYPGASVVNWCRANASNHSYITQHWNSYMPQFKRCVATTFST